MYTVLETATFAEERAKYEIPERYMTKLRERLKTNPQQGKPLGTPFLREKRYENKRIYYLIYEELEAVFLVAVSDKKTQQATIKDIKASREAYEEAVRAYFA